MDWEWVKKHKSILEALGFVLALHADNEVEMKGHPADVVTAKAKSLLEALIVQGQLTEAPLTLESHVEWARTMARSVALPAGTPMTSETMDQLVDELFACQNTMYSPSGDKITIKMDMDTIQKWFVAGGIAID